jgi:hypothetical protein
MATISDVIKKFLSDPDKITEVLQSQKEYYFRYGNHCFSVTHRTQEIQKYGVYSVYVYPKWHGDTYALAQVFSLGDPGNIVDMVSYHVKDLPEMYDDFVRLYRLLEEKYLKIDEIFKNVLES